MKSLRPPIPGDSPYYSQTTPSQQNLRPPLPSQDINNNNIKNPFSNNTPKFTNPNKPFQKRNTNDEDETKKKYRK